MIEVTPCRIGRVQRLLEREPAFREMANQLGVTLKTRRGRDVKMSDAALIVTEALCAAGIDAERTEAKQILKMAFSVLGHAKLSKGNSEPAQQ